MGIIAAKGVRLDGFDDLHRLNGISVLRGLAMGGGFDENARLRKEFDTDYQTGLRKLAHGRVEAVAGAMPTIRYLAAQMGLDHHLGQQLLLSQMDLVLQCSLKSPHLNAMEQFNRAIRDMRDDGTLDAIFRSNFFLMNKHRPSLRGIGLRVLVLIVLFSSMVTLVSTGLQLYLDYRHDMGTIDNRLRDIGNSTPDSLAVALWNVDAAGLRLHLDGLLRLPDIQFAEVRETTSGVAKPLRVQAGILGDGPSRGRDYPLLRENRGQTRQIGVLRVEASLDGVHDRLREKVMIILASQGIKTFIVSLFTLYIVHRLITRHLVTIAQYFSRYDAHGSAPPLKLHRRQPATPDELDQLTASFATMATNLEAAYRELSGVNAELERDIAERQARERVLQQTLDNLAAANRELERFAFVASHDLQEPLRSIVSFAQLLSRQYAGQLDQRADEYIGFIVSGGQRMHALINDLLTYTRVDGQMAEFTTFSSAESCAQAMENLDEAIKSSDAHIQVAALPVIVGDPIQMMQLFQNLLANAIKFQPPGQQPVITVGACQEGAMWRFTITDNGIGMDLSGPDPFEIFRRQHPAHKYPGTGIGLAICKRIVERHGGTIWIESPAEAGTRFHFTLPGAAHTP